MSKQFDFKWRKARASSPARKDENAPAPARPLEGRVEPAPVAKPAPAAKPAPVAKPTPAQAVPVPSAERPRPSHERIAVRAYELWVAQGRPEGTQLTHWFDAERQLLSEGR